MDFEVGGYEYTIGMVDNCKNINNCDANSCEDMVTWWAISKRLVIGYVVIYFRRLQCPPIFVKKIKQINEHKGWKGTYD
jgi:hypothetical protein